MVYKIPFSGRGHAYTPDEYDVVAEVMRNADPLTQGRYRDAFEKRFAEYIGVPNCFSVCNATAALEMAAQLCQFNPGDEIVAPAFTFTSSVYPFLKQGAKVVWADVDPETNVVSAETLKACITDKTKVLLVVHLFGYMAEMGPIIELAEEHGLLVVEDSAQSMGTDIDGRQCGSFGDFGIYSFHSHKNITTLGEGGVLAVKDPEMAKVVPMLRHNGHCAFDYDRDDYWIPAMGNLDFPTLNGQNLWPNNYCLGEVECALGTRLMDRLDQMNQEKRDRALYFIDALTEFPELRFQREPSTRHNYHLLVGWIDNGSRDAFIRTMAGDKGVQCIVQYYPLYRYDFYKKLGFGEAYVPNTDYVFDNMVSFPFQHWMPDSDLEFMLEATKDVLAGLR